MEIKTDTTEIINDLYDEYEFSQFIVQMNIGEQVIIRVDGVVVKEYTAKYTNCHFNLGFQDKGIKVERTEVDLIQKQIDKLEAEKLEAEAKETK